MTTKILTSAAVAALIAGASSAATITLERDGGTPSVQVDTTAETEAGRPGALTGAYNAQGFYNTAAELGGDRFLAWCVDLEHRIGNGLYEYGASFLGAETEQRLSNLFSASFAGVDVTDAAQAAGFQIAIWETVFEAPDAIGDLFSGTYGLETPAAGSAATNAASSYLAAAAGYTGPALYNVTYLYGLGERQDLVTATPVPVPAAFGMLALGLGGLGFAARRRKG